MNALPFALPRRSNHSGSTSYVRIIALSEFANAAITRTLNVMRDSGEARCVTSCETSGLPSFWQRIPPPAEIDG